MHRSCLALLLTISGASSQVAIQSYWTAWNAGKFTEAAALRETLRHTVATTSADDPEFGAMTNSLAQMDFNAGMPGRARTVLQDALARSTKLAESDPARTQLLISLAVNWQNDGNLLEAVAAWRRVIATLEAPPGKATPSLRQPRMLGMRLPGNEYLQLALLSGRLGRPEEAAAVMKNYASRAPDKSQYFVQAQFYEQTGDLDQAEAIYRHTAEQALSDPASASEATGALQMLAGLYQREQRYTDAVEVLQQALKLITSPNDSVGMRQNLAGALSQAGQLQAADQIYQQLLAETATNQNGQYEQILTMYAYQMAQTNRADAAETMLKDYMAGLANRQPAEDVNLLYTLANVANVGGHGDRGNAYMQAAQEKQRLMSPASEAPIPITVAPDLEKALGEAGDGHADEALAVAWQAMGAASNAADRERVPPLVANLASSLVASKPEQAERLFERLLLLVESWRDETIEPLLNAQQSYLNFLVRAGRGAEVPKALERYGDTVLAAHGAGSGAQAGFLQTTIQIARSQNAPERALIAAKDLLQLEESLSGSTSQPYLQALSSLAESYEWNGGAEQALALRLRAVTIADLCYAHDLQRGQVRINAALALAGQGRFEEAERLGQEATAIAGALGQADAFGGPLRQVQEMKASYEARSFATEARARIGK